MGLAEWFSTFCSALQVRNKSTISSRYRTITRRLNLDFYDTDSNTSHSLYVGSYGRNTAINGISDLDMLFQLPFDLYTQYNAYTSNGQSALLQAVRNSLRTTYPNSEIGGDGQVVVVAFQDRPTFEVLPAFLNTDHSFTHPDANGGGSWRITNPRPEIDAVRTRSAECNGNLIPLCRMMRAWKNKWDVPIRGILIDTLSYQFIADWGHKDKSYYYYDLMCRDFFKFMKNQRRDQNYWLAPGSGRYVYRRGSFEAKAAKCYNIALKAIETETSNPNAAKNHWRSIFGSAFPQ